MVATAKKIDDQRLLAYKNNQIIYLGDSQVKHWDELSPNQLKIAMFSAAKVKHDDTSETKYTMTFKEFADLCKFDSDTSGGSAYERVYREARKMARLGVDFIDNQGDTVMFNWLTSVRISPKSGTVTYKLDEALLPFYKTKKGTFAIINLLDYMPLRGRYALLLFEFLAKWQNKGKVYQTVDDLRSQLHVPDGKYKRIIDFMAWVLRPAIEEINEKVQYSFHVKTTEKRGKYKKVEGITFYINFIGNVLPTVDENTDLIDLLQEAGVDVPVSTSIINTFSRERISANVQYAKGIEKKGKIKKSLAAMVCDSIAQDYAEVEQLSLLSVERIVRKQAKDEANASLAQLAAAKMEAEEKAAADIPINPDSPYAKIAKKIGVL